MHRPAASLKTARLLGQTGTRRWRAARGAAVAAVRAADRYVSAAFLSLRREHGGLSTFMFHGVFADRAEVDRGDAHPQQGVTVADFRAFVAYLLGCGYQFVSVADVLAGLPPGPRYAMVTFDDGYFSNSRVVPVLEEFDVPAVVFVSTGHVMGGKCFWWDVLYREGLGRGASAAEIAEETERLKLLRTEEVEADLARRFGRDALRPRGDADRPFTAAELKDFAAHRLVTLGNHTADHAILPRYTPEEMRRQLRDAQDVLREVTGAAPAAVAYPNGEYSDAVVEAARSVDLRLGIGIEPRKNRLPIDVAAGDAMRLGRFTPPGGDALLPQLRVFRADVRLYDSLRLLARKGG